MMTSFAENTRDFGLMTSQELTEYSGQVYMARCVFERDGTRIPCDYECPTPALREASVARGRARIGFLVSREDFDYWRQQTGPKWAKAFGGIDGRCGTNPEDVPDEMMTAQTFWAHANKNGTT
jgi:hypothetical protein